MKTKERKSSLSKISGIAAFFCVSAFLWLIIKLSDTYTVTIPFNVMFTDKPANQILPNNDFTVDATIESAGFRLLNYYLRPKRSRKVEISLKENKYKSLNDDKYSLGSSSIGESIANFMEISTNDVSIDKEELVFMMFRLASKRVKVVPQTNISFEGQYYFYGEPTVTPDSITLSGAFNIIRDIDFVNTKTLVGKNIKSNVISTIGLELEDGVFSDTEEVCINIDVEKYTESEVIIPINTLNISNICLFPDRARIRYIVAMKDYPNISNLSFNIEIDTTNFKAKDLLPLKLMIYPNNTKVIGISPSEVEYILTK